MKNVRNKKFSIKNIITIFVVAIAVLIFLKAITSSNRFPKSVDQPINSQINSVNTHISRDLKISFKYPKDWYIDDRYHMILLTNYKTNLNKNDETKNNQIRIDIDSIGLCQSNLDEEIIKNGCGEGNAPQAKILDKKMRNLDSGTFYTYTIKNSIGQQIYYYLQSGDRILQISKEPKPSRFEKEFEDIISSIKFL